MTSTKNFFFVKLEMATHGKNFYSERQQIKTLAALKHKQDNCYCVTVTNFKSEAENKLPEEQRQVKGDQRD